VYTARSALEKGHSKGTRGERRATASSTSGLRWRVGRATCALDPRNVDGDAGAEGGSARDMDRPRFARSPERRRGFLDAGQRGAHGWGGNLAGGEDPPEMGRQLGGPHDGWPVSRGNLGRLPRRVERQNFPGHAGKNSAAGSLRLVAKRPRPGPLVAERLVITRVRARSGLAEALNAPGTRTRISFGRSWEFLDRLTNKNLVEKQPHAGQFPGRTHCLGREPCASAASGGVET
jgi:hypothetical protein